MAITVVSGLENRSEFSFRIHSLSFPAIIDMNPIQILLAIATFDAIGGGVDEIWTPVVNWEQDNSLNADWIVSDAFTLRVLQNHLLKRSFVNSSF